MMEIPELEYDVYADWMYGMAEDMYKTLVSTL